MHKVLKFTPNRVWRTYQGGLLLDQIEGKKSPSDSHFPENWIGSVVEAKNIGREDISEGLAHVYIDAQPVPFKTELLRHQEYYLGNTRASATESLGDIPLVKYLDSATRLHFQVHPTREFAQSRLNSNHGKTEAYVILAIRDDITNPYIYAGFQRPPTRAQLKEWIETQNIQAIESCFDKIPVKPGDVVLLPGGRPHALGEGILMLEIMEPSDWAVRFEFERCGYVIPEAARFMNRGIETALDVFNFEPVMPEEIDAEFRCSTIDIYEDAKQNQLACLIGPELTDCFTVKRAIIHTQLPRHETSFFIGIVTQGSGEILIDNEHFPIKQWDTFFIPAQVIDFAYSTNSTLQILECYPGETPSMSHIPDYA